MSQVITTRNNKQSGGTYVSIKPTDDSSAKFETSEDNNLILTSLLEGCESINCINVSSVNSIVFDGVLNGNGNIRIYSERTPDKPIPKICIKISFIRTPETPENVTGLEFMFEESTKQPTTYYKSIKTADELEKEGDTQKQMFDSLQPNVLKDIIPDTIAMGIVKPADFEEFTTKIFDKSIEGWKTEEELAKKDEKTVLTVKVIQWIIEQANEHKLDLHLFFMDLFEGDEQFLQNVVSLTDKTILKGQEITSVTEFHNTGYYKDVYTIVEIVGAYIISILEITGVWNYDLTLRNIMVNRDDKSAIKFIDFGYNKNLKDPAVKKEIVDIFIYVYEKYSMQQLNIRKFVDVPLLKSNTAKEKEDAIKSFLKCYDDIIMKLSSNIQTLLKPDSTDALKRTKRKIVFKTLMFLAFIDGLIQRVKFNGISFQCKDIMELMFNCTIFVDFDTFVEYSSLDYFKFLDDERIFAKRLPIINKLKEKKRYMMLCNIILDKICIHIAGLLSESAKQRYTSSEGGKGISKKRYPRLRKSTRRPLRRKSGTKRLRLRRRRSNRRSRTSRK